MGGGMITACSVRLETYLRVSMHRGREEAAMSTLSNFEKHDSSMLFSACSIQIGQDATLALALRSHVFVATLATLSVVRSQSCISSPMTPWKSANSIPSI